MTPWYGTPNHAWSFLKHLEYGACVKYLQTYSKLDKCYFVGYPKFLGISPPLYRGKRFCHKMVCFWRNGSCKKVSGRIVQLDEITVSSSSGQRKETLEVIPEFPTATDTEASTWDVWTSVKLATEPRRQNLCKPLRCAKEILLLDNSIPLIQKVVLMGPDFGIG